MVDKFFIIGNDIPKLDEEDRELCEGKISEEECVEVIKTFKNGKSPGTDGLPIEFYKISGTTLKILLSTPFLIHTNR